MTFDSVIGKLAFHIALKSLDELKTKPLPLSYRDQMQTLAMMPKANMQDLLNGDCGWWSGYASCMIEIKELFDSMPKADIKSKAIKPA